jgi:hypothetical protein
MKSLISSYFERSGILLWSSFLADLLTPQGTDLMELKIMIKIKIMFNFSDNRKNTNGEVR